MRRMTSVSGMSHLKYKERCVQHQEGHICSSRRRLCSMRASVHYPKCTYAVKGCVVCGDSLQYQGCHIWSTRRESVQ